MWEVRINGEVVGESGINALVAAHYHVPIILVSGDEATIQEAQLIAPQAEHIVVKQSIGRFAASHLHPDRVREMLQAAATRAVHACKEMQFPQFELPVTLEITFLVADMAEMALWIRGVERVAPRTVKVTGEHLLDLYRTFVTIVTLTRSLVDR